MACVASVHAEVESGQTEYTLNYSFGTATAPDLVRRKVVVFRPTRPTPLSTDEYQEVCMEQRDALLSDLCTVFDDAATQFQDAVQTLDSLPDHATATAAREAVFSALELMLGSSKFAVCRVLAHISDAKYALFFKRVQLLMNLLDVVTMVAGPACAAAVSKATQPLLDVLRSIDRGFAEKAVAARFPSEVLGLGCEETDEAPPPSKRGRADE